ncbi:MAG: hypothetical protein CMJ33_09520 [Phycisphaerae bacterium]|nr:hypothetical protein [Phycisphaerae bacterium]
MSDDLPTPERDSSPDSSPKKGITVPRRSMLLLGLGALAGCATSKARTTLPSALWPTTQPTVVAGTPVPPSPVVTAGLTNTLSRTAWAKGVPIPSRMNRMDPPRKITIHHDGMSPFAGTSRASVADRIELIRVSHLKRDGGNRWGDIGYHFVVDRSGRVWQARPVSYQGAHVKHQNEANVGVLCLGNFETQTPSRNQVRRLEALIVELRAQYRVPLSRVYTHRELDSTKCPGRHLQSAIQASRSAGRFS